MEIGFIREGSNERTRDRRERRKASRAKKAAEEAAKIRVVDTAEMVTAEGTFQVPCRP